MNDKNIVLEQLWLSLTLREKCLYLELFWFVFSRIQTYSARMRENNDQKNCENGNISRIVKVADF